MVSMQAHSQELVGLKELISSKPLFFSKKNDTQIIASRCSALYLVLDSRSDEALHLNATQALSSVYLDRALVYNQVKEILSKADNTREISQGQQKLFAKCYADITMSNWKNYGDIFKGIVNDDLDVCEKNYSYYRKLALGLNKETKK